MEERHILEREVTQHRSALAELLVSLAGLEESMRQSPAEQERLARKALALRWAVKGREAAVTIGAARLAVLNRCAALAAE